MARKPNARLLPRIEFDIPSRSTVRGIERHTLSGHIAGELLVLLAVDVLLSPFSHQQLLSHPPELQPSSTHLTNRLLEAALKND